MVSEQEERFIESVERFTNKNNRVVNHQDLAVVRRFIQSHHNGPEFTYQILLERLKQNNSQSRFLAFEVLDYIFLRCRGVRQCVSDDIKTILQLSIGYGRKHKLPQPPQSAWKLRNFAIAAAKKWNKKYGIKYPQIRVAMQYLQRNLQMQFPQIVGAEELEQQQQQERRKKEISTREYRKIDRIYEGYVQQVLSVQKQLEESVKLLRESNNKSKKTTDVQNVQDALEDEGSFSWEEIDTQQVEQEPKIGLDNYATVFSPKNLSNSQQEELEAQKILVTNLQDVINIARKEHIPKIQKWLRIMSGAEVGNSQQDPPYIQLQSRIRELIELKSNIVHVQNQGKELLENYENNVPQEGALEGTSQKEQTNQDDLEKIFDTISKCSKQQELEKQNKNNQPKLNKNELNNFEQINNQKLENDLNGLIFQKNGSNSKNFLTNDGYQVNTDVEQQTQNNIDKSQNFKNSNEILQQNIDKSQEFQNSNEILHNNTIDEQTIKNNKKKSNLSEEVKQKLLKEAPIFPAGFDPISALQNSSNQSSLNPNALDIYNHWGPVDKDAQIQGRAYQQFFGYHTSYYKPPINKIQQDQQTAKKRKISENLQKRAKQRKAIVEGGNLSTDVRTQRELDRRYNQSILSTKEDQQEEQRQQQQKDKSLSAKQRILKVIKKR